MGQQLVGVHDVRGVWIAPFKRREEARANDPR